MEQNKSRRIGLYILLTFVVIIAIISAFFFAKYIKSTEEIPNNFSPATETDPEIDEDFNGELKKDVKFNVGEIDYPVYVRAAIVITWKKKDGDTLIVHFTEPKKATNPGVDEDGSVVYDGDYIIDLNLDDWELAPDGYYYYKEIVYPDEGGGETRNLIDLCKQVGPAPEEGYFLSVEIIAQTVQAVGYTDGEDEEDTNVIDAWRDAWSSYTETAETPEP